MRTARSAARGSAAPGSHRSLGRAACVVLTAAAVLLGVAPAMPVTLAAAEPAVLPKTRTGALLKDAGKAAPEPSFSTGTSRDAEPAVAPPVRKGPLATGSGVPAPPVVGEKRQTPGTEMTRQADGTWVARLFQEPTFRKGADGKRTKADQTLTPGTDPETSFEAGRAYQPVKFGKNANKLVEVDLGKGKVRLGSRDLTLGQAVPNAAGELRYADVAPDTDLILGLSGAGVRFQLVLKSAKAPTSYSFDLTDPAGALGTGKADGDGGFAFSSPVDDGVTMGFDAPFAYSQDLENPEYAPGYEPGSARLDVAPVKGGYRLTKTVDAEWLKGKAFPIVLDPRFSANLAVPAGSADRNVQAKDCTLVGPDLKVARTETQVRTERLNFCTSNNELGFGSGFETSGSVRRLLHQFDLSSIPADSTVTAGSLNLFMTTNFHNQTLPTAAVQGGRDWLEPKATWNTSDGVTPWQAGDPVGAAASGPTAINVGQVPTTTNGNNNGSNRYYTWPITDLVQRWTNRTTANNGVIVRMSPEVTATSAANAASRVFAFASRRDASASTRAPYLDVTFTPPPTPQITKSVAPATGSGTSSLQAGAFSGGAAAPSQTLIYTVKVTNPGPNAQTVRVSDPGSAGVAIAAGTLQVTNAAGTATACAAAAGCALDTAVSTARYPGIRISALELPAGGSRTLTYAAAAVPTSERQCEAVRNTAEVAGSGGRALAALDTLVCDRALGLENWFSYTGTTATGPQGTAQVNVANGNLVVQQVDSAPMQGHGRLGFTLRRTYNSQDTSLVTLPGSLGAGWQLNFGEAGDALSDGVSPSGLSVPRLPSPLQPLPVTMADRDGTRHVFQPKTTQIKPESLLQLGTGTKAPDLPALAVKTIKQAQDTNLCIDAGYKAPPGVHLGLFRYLQITPGSGPCLPKAGELPVVAGFASIRPDRFRSEYSADGRLLLQVDAAGNELRYQYEGQPTAADAPVVQGAALGRLTRVYEQRTCDDPRKACRAFTFDYDEANKAKVTDPAGRTTTYEFSSPAAADPSGGVAALTQRLDRVVNPDGSTLAYTYATTAAPCGASTVGQLCSIADGRGNLTRFAYSAPADSGPARVASVSDRRGTKTDITYDGDRTGTTAVRGGQRKQRFSGIDAYGRVAGLADLDAGNAAVRETSYTWDRPESRNPDGTLRQAVNCTRPAPVAGTVDHNLCDTTRQQKGTVDGKSAVATSPRQATRYEYTANGNVLRALRSRTGNAAAPDSDADVTTMGYTSLYYRGQQDGSVAGYTDKVLGGRQVASDAPAPTPENGSAREDAGGTTLFSIEDRVESLSPLGNQVPANTTDGCAAEKDCAQHLTQWQIDVPAATDAAQRPPNTRPTSGLCAGAPGANTGLPCSMTGPAVTTAKPATADQREPRPQARPQTLYSYDDYGQRATMKTPLAVSRTGTSLSDRYTYSYYGDFDFDLAGSRTTPVTDLASRPEAGSVNAGGWLKAVTDPAGAFVAYGYDKAGNTARTWDRRATAKRGAPVDAYPGTVTAPTSPDYTQTLRAPGSDSQALAAKPWRYVLTTRDALGNTTGSCVDLHGSALVTRPARGYAQSPLDCAALTDPKTGAVLTTTSTGAANPALGAYDTLLGRPEADDRTSTVLTPEEAARNRGDRPDRPADRTDYPTRFAYNAFGELASTTDPRGNIRTSTYDVVGRQTTSSWTRGMPSPLKPGAGIPETPECQSADGPATTTAADGLGTPGKVKCTTTNAYDSLDQLVATTDAAGARTDLEYDALGRQTRNVATRTAAKAATETTPAVAAVRLESRTVYDANSRPVLSCPPRQFAEGGGNCNVDASPAQRKYSTLLGYDPSGNSIGSETYREKTVSFGDFAGLDTLVTLAAYDVDGNQTETVEPNALPGITQTDGTVTPATLAAPGNATYRTTTSYDLLDRPTATTRPRGENTAFTDTVTYDPVGTVKAARRQTGGTASDPTSSVTAYSYDALNRPVDTVEGATSPDATAAGLYDPAAGTNARSRTFYDADGNVVATLPPRAFENNTGRKSDGTADTTGPVTVDAPNTALLRRYDYDLNGRASGGYKPRYDNRVGSDSADPRRSATQAADCPTSRRPADIAGVPNYPASVGVCSSAVTYDPSGNVLTSRAANSNGTDARITRYRWTDDNQLAATDAPNPAGTDKAGTDCARAASPGRAWTCLRYDGGGRATIARDAKGDQTVSTYDLDGTLIGTDRPNSTGPDPANPAGTTEFTHTSSSTYDANGNTTSTTNELGQTARTVFYADGRPAEIGDTGGSTTPGSTSRGVNTTRYSYDRNGNATAVMSPSAVGLRPATAGGPRTGFDKQFPVAESTRNFYTRDNLLAATYTPITVTSAGATTWRAQQLRYDAAGRKTADTTTETPALPATNEQAAAAAALIPATPNANTQTFTYDPLDRITTQTGRQAASNQSALTARDTITTRYDADGNPVSMTNRSTTSSGAADDSPTGTTTSTLAATYYLDGLLKTMTDDDAAGSGGAGPGKLTEHTYDGQGQRTTRADGPVPARLADAAPTRTTRYAYSPAQELDSVTDSDVPTGTPSNAVTFGYDTAGRPTSQANPNGTTVGWTYQADDTLSQQTLKRGDTTLATWEYRYDGLGRVARQSLTGTGAAGTPGAPNPALVGTLPTGNWDYRYDTAGRLEAFTPQGGTQRSVTYDRNGNRTAYDRSSFDYRADDTIERSTDTASAPGSPAVTRGYDYNTWGGTKSDGCSSYRYDGFDRRTAAQAGTTAGCGAASTSTYTYDAADRERTHTSTKTTSRAPANVTTTTHYDGMSQAIAISSVAGRGDSRYVLDPQGSPLALASPTSTAGSTGLDLQWLTADGQGNVAYATGAPVPVTGAQTLCAARFDPFGSAVNSKPDTACASGESQNDVWWRGGRMDSASGQYQFGARTYTPGSSSWLTPDTYRTGGSAANTGLRVDPLTRNSYAYVNGDPVNATDINGHRIDCDGPCGSNKGGYGANAGNSNQAYKPTKQANTVTKPAAARPEPQDSANRVRLTKVAEKKCGVLNYVPCQTARKAAQVALRVMDIDMPDLSTVVHAGLDVAGMVPVIGEAADGLNAVVYLAENNKAMAALSLAAMVPIAGNAVTIGKVGKQALNAIGAGRASRATVKTADASSSGITAKVATGSPLQAAPAPSNLANKAPTAQAKAAPAKTDVAVKKAATGGGDAPEMVTIYRNVDAAEFDDIARTGKFSQGPGMMEGKNFATTKADADRWGELLNKGEGLTVETDIPMAVAKRLYFEPGKLDGVGPAYFAYAKELEAINRSMTGIRLSS